MPRTIGRRKSQCRAITEWIGRLTSAISPSGLRTASAQVDGPAHHHALEDGLAAYGRIGHV